MFEEDDHSCPALDGNEQKSIPVHPKSQASASGMPRSVPPTSEHATFEPTMPVIAPCNTLTIRGGINGIREEAGRLGWKEECQSALKEHLQNHIRDGDGSGAYWYWQNQGEEFFTLKHLPAEDSSVIGYHRATSVPDQEDPSKERTHWHVGTQTVNWVKESPHQKPPSDSPASQQELHWSEASQGEVKKQEDWVHPVLSRTIREAMCDPPEQAWTAAGKTISAMERPPRNGIDEVDQTFGEVGNIIFHLASRNVIPDITKGSTFHFVGQGAYKPPTHDLPDVKDGSVEPTTTWSADNVPTHDLPDVKEDSAEPTTRWPTGNVPTHDLPDVKEGSVEPTTTWSAGNAPIHTQLEVREDDVVDPKTSQATPCPIPPEGGLPPRSVFSPFSACVPFNCFRLSNRRGRHSVNEGRGSVYSVSLSRPLQTVNDSQTTLVAEAEDDSDTKPGLRSKKGIFPSDSSSSEFPNGSFGGKEI